MKCTGHGCSGDKKAVSSFGLSCQGNYPSCKTGVTEFAGTPKARVEVWK